ncbi:MAG: hypothetical protein QOE35_3139 [Actinomycetota bacterium]|jgi:hypothetical protein
MKRILLGAVAAIALLVLPIRLAAAEPVSEETQFLALLNQLRVQQGLGALTPDSQLQGIARQWSAKMVGDGALSHNPNLATQVSNWRMIGENVGVGGSVQQLHDAFVASPHHYANMIEPAFDAVGIGVVDAGSQIWVTVDFKQSKSAAAPVAAPKAPPVTTAPKPKPAPAPRPAAAPRPAPAPKPAAATASKPAAPTPAAKPAVAPAPAPAGAATTAAPAPGAAPEVAGRSFARPTPTGASHDAPLTMQTGAELLAVALLVVMIARLVRLRRS